MENLFPQMILQVHDELLFEGPKSELTKLAHCVQKEMSGAAKFSVPMDVSLKSGPNWLDMKEL